MLFCSSDPSVSGTLPYFACWLDSARPPASGTYHHILGVSLDSLSSCLFYVLHTWNIFLSHTAAIYLSIYLLDQAVSFLKSKAKTALLSLVLNKVTSIEQELHNYCWIIKWIFNSSKKSEQKENRSENGRANMGWLTIWKKENGNYEERKKCRGMIWPYYCYSSVVQVSEKQDMP